MNRLVGIAFAAIGLMLFAARALGGGADDPAPGAASPPAAWSATAAPRSAPHTNRAALVSGETLTIARDETGQFHVEAAVNGQDTRFLVDTGASSVALTLGEAQRLGLQVDEALFEPVVMTASGPGMGARLRLERLNIGGTELRDVDAVVVRGLPVNLLGQNVLARVGKVELEGDRLTIQPG